MLDILLSLILPAAGYFLCLAAVTLAAWLATCALTPDYCRGGLRLVTVLIGHVALNAAVVQTLGLLGILRPMYYLGICAVIGAASIWGLGRYFPTRSLSRLVRGQARLWVRETPYGLGLLGFGWLAYAGFRCSLVEGIDPLTLHGPLVVGWVQSGSIPLLWHFNYPICWELQFAANILLMGSDILVLVPRLWIGVTLLLVVKELGRQVGLTGGQSQLIAWPITALPYVFGISGEMAMKNDPALAVGLLAGLIALDRLWHRRAGGFWLLQLSIFMLMGTKSTGIVMSVGFMGLGVAFAAWHGRTHLTGRRIAGVLAGILLMQATPIALPLKNFLTHGSPFYPVVVDIAGHELPGRMNLKGTSILDNRDHPEIWKMLTTGAGFRISFEVVGMWVLFALGTCWWLWRWLAVLLGKGWRAAIADTLTLRRAYYSCAGAVLWLMFLVTPWTAGSRVGTFEFVAGGNSLRYAIGQIALTYVLAVVFARRHVGSANLTRILALALPAIFYARWFPSLWRLARDASGRDPHKLLLGFIAVLVGLWWIGKGLPAIDRRLRRSRLGESAWPVAVFLALLIAMPIFADLHSRLRRATWGEINPTSRIFRGIQEYVRDDMPEGSVIASSMPQLTIEYNYFFLGPTLKNRMVLAPDPLRSPGAAVPREADYFFMAYYARQGPLQQAVAALERRGWQSIIEVGDGVGVLLRRSPPDDETRASDPLFDDGFESGDASAWKRR